VPDTPRVIITEGPDGVGVDVLAEPPAPFPRDRC